MARKQNVNTEVVTETIETSKVEVSMDTVENLMKEHKTKSGVVRYLTAQGHTRAAIAKHLGIRYQHVRNILVTPLKKVDEPTTAEA